MDSSFKIEVWPADSRRITQPFGVNPETYKRFGAPGHTGIDITGVEGSTNIFCVAPGRVTRVGRAETDTTGFGNHVYVQHANGYKTIYAHLYSLNVSQNQTVSAGTVIGKMGNTGFSTGTHLHFELRGPTGMPGWPRNIIDPTPFLAPHLGITKPAGPYRSGWVIEWGITAINDLAQVTVDGLSFRDAPSQSGNRIEVLDRGTIVIVTGSTQNEYVPVQVSSASVGEPPPPPPPPAPEFPPMVSTIDGWGFASYITTDANGLRGTVGPYGINLRADPRRDGEAIGIVGGGAQVTITGAQSGEYVPVKAARNDFVGEINMVQASPPKPTAGVLSAHGGVSANTCLGWGWTEYLDLRGEKAVVGQFGINLRSEPNEFGAAIGVVKGLSVVTIAGQAEGNYTPLLVDRTDMITVEANPPRVQTPKPLTTTAPESAQPTSPTPPKNSTPGWAFTAALNFSDVTAIAGQYGINLRDNPRRNANNIGFVPAGTSMFLVGAAQGEYTPVRVDDNDLQAPMGAAPAAASSSAPAQTTAPASTTTTPTVTVTAPSPIETPVFGQAKIGLHASATPAISAAEIAEFKTLRPGMIKVLSFHDPDAIRQLVQNHPNVKWVVRAFLSFGNRNISPDQFVNDTIGDTKRTLNILQGQDVVIELHNEPNLTTEGLGSTWGNGTEFNNWWLQVLNKYKAQLPNHRYIFPGLSPGPDQGGLRQADRPFLEACRPAINASDGLGMHSYWSNPHFPILTHPDSGVPLVDDYIRRFPNKLIWITEASNNLGSDWNTKAREYFQFWHEMQKRPSVQGITYFVASAAPGTFEHETWVGHGIAAKLGAR